MSKHFDILKHCKQNNTLTHDDILEHDNFLRCDDILDMTSFKSW